MDYLALIATGKLLGMQTKNAELLIASSLGGLYGVMQIFLEQHAGSRLLGYTITLAVGLLMCFIVFGGGSARLLFRSYLLFFLLSLLMGGAMTFLYAIPLRRQSETVGEQSWLQEVLPFSAYAAAFGFCAALIYLCTRWFSGRRHVAHTGISVRCDGREITLSCLVDSGNLLHEPVSGDPVILVAPEALEGLLPHRMRSFFRRGEAGALDTLPPADAKRVRLIPIRSVGHTGLLLGYRPEEVIVEGRACHACLAVEPGAHKFDGCQAVLPVSLMP